MQFTTQAVLVALVVAGISSSNAAPTGRVPSNWAESVKDNPNLAQKQTRYPTSPKDYDPLKPSQFPDNRRMENKGESSSHTSPPVQVRGGVVDSGAQSAIDAAMKLVSEQGQRDINGIAKLDFSIFNPNHKP